MLGQIRIIAGKHKGRKLPVLEADGLRPTTDRIKETLFNWLMNKISNANCLDCYAGSGSLGFEAFSRGAKSVTMLENNVKIAQQLKKNSNSFEPLAFNIINADSIIWLNKNALQCFDLVFIDPPFNKGLAIKTIFLLEEQSWLSSNAYIYVETELNGLNKNDVPVHWQLYREKTTGKVHFFLFKRELD